MKRSKSAGELRLRSAICARDVKQKLSASWVDQPPAHDFRADATGDDAFDALLAKLTRDESPSLPDVRSGTECWGRAAFGKKPIAEIVQVDVCAWIGVMREHLAPNTVLGRFSILRQALELARQARVLAVNPCVGLPKGILPPRKARPGFDAASEICSPLEAARILGEACGVDQLSGAMMMLGGLRWGEAASAQFKHINRTTGPLWTLTIERSWSRKNKRFQPPKTGVKRQVPIHRALQTLLERWLSGGWARLFGRDPKPDDLLIPRVLAGELAPLNDRTALRRWHSLLRRVGLAKRRIHSLRHTFVSMLLAAGADWRAVERITHPTPRWRSLEVYAHFQWPMLCAAVSRLELELVGSHQLELFPRQLTLRD